MLDREQGGRLVRQVWIEQVHKHIPNPKHSYVCPWEEMPEWERETDRAIFDAIATALRQELSQELQDQKHG
jgi:mono/diheme cytochrome c family protein